MMNVAVRVHEQLVHGRQLVVQERRDLHFVVREVKDIVKARRVARGVFEEKNPSLQWIAANATGERELRALVKQRPPPGKKFEQTMYGPGNTATLTSTGRRRR
jgi:hypothetical protein